MFGKVKSFSYENCLKACAKKQKSALQQLYKQESSLMMALALRVLQNDHSLAESAIIETFKIIWTNASYYDEANGYGRAWIYTILRYKIKRIYIEKNLVANISPINPQDADLLEGLQAEIQNENDSLHNFNSYLYDLTKEQRLAILKLYFSGLSQAQAATQLHTSLAHLKENVQIALHYLYKKVGDFPSNTNTILYGEYVLGGISENEENKVQQLFATDSTSMISVLKWENYFLDFTQQLHGQNVSGECWNKIKLLAFVDPTKNTKDNIEPPPQEDDLNPNSSSHTVSSAFNTNQVFALLKPYWNQISLWRIASAVLLALCIILLLMPSRPTGSSHLAVLSDSLNHQQTPSWLIKLNDKNNLLIKPLVQRNLGEALSMQLWTRNNSTEAYRSLGLLDSNKSYQLSAQQAGKIAEGTQFIVTIEAKGGSKTASPTGSVLASGYLLNTAQ